MKQQAIGPPAPQLVTDQSELDELCGQLRAAGRFAFDTEFVMETEYRPIVCLMQTATDSLTALIDPLSGVDVRGVWSLVNDPAVETIVHAGAEDLALCYHRTQAVPQNVFDVQIAAGLIGLDYPLSLRRLTHALLGVRLHKSQTLTDWRRRPLSKAQISYAAEDVAHLPAMYTRIVKRLKKHGRLRWAVEEFSRFEQPGNYDRDETQRVRRLKGSGSLNPKGLVVAAALLECRERLAEQANRPPRVLLRDYLLLEIARHAWTDPREIRSLRGLSLSNDAVRALARTVKDALATPPDTWPEPTPTRETSPQEEMLTAMCGAVVRDFCLKNAISYSLVTNKQELHNLARHLVNGRYDEEPPALLRGWRGHAVGSLLRRLTSGEVRIAVTMKDGQPELCIE